MVVAVAVVAAAACGAAAFPRIVGAVSARAHGLRIDSLRASPQTKLDDSLPEIAAAFRRGAFPSVDFLGDMKGVYSSAADRRDEAAFDCAVRVRGAPTVGAGPTEAVPPQDYRSGVRPDHRKEPSC